MVVPERVVKIDGEPKSNELRVRASQVIAKGHKTYTPTQALIAKADGIFLITEDGARLMDFASGVLVANLGHNHRFFEAKYAEYSRGIPRTAYNTFTRLEVEAAERLIASLNCPKLQRILWAATGSEGIIKAIWCAQHKSPDKPIILATRDGFHGKKGLAGDVTGNKSKNPNVRFISFPLYDYYEMAEKEPPEVVESKLRPKYQKELDDLAREYPNRICALVTEPYLGAKGSFHPPTWYLQMLNQWCDEHDVVFILDEVQSCFGRTGEMYAFQKHGLQPDIVVLGKGVGNGEPVAVVAGRSDLLESLDYGEGSDTFSGNPRACAAILAALDTFEQFPIIENCRKSSITMERELNSLKEDFDLITHVRGEGLVWGVEVRDRETANRVVLNAYLRYRHDNFGVHMMGPLADKVIRISPPLIITPTQVSEGIGVIRRAITEIG